YSNRNIPYRKDYLLYNLPETEKSSLNKIITGYISLDIYILNLFTINKANLISLFIKFPSYYIILLKDIN
ncbi:hypothetical protein NA56DRAFT_542650, partial [Hyaloscypha hepaticicola]